MSEKVNHIDKSKLPRHVAIIMDGNGRWAKEQGQNRVSGHREGVKTVREITEAAAEIGIEYLTLYTFSTENWQRPAFEVNALMMLLIEAVRAEIDTLMRNEICLKVIGDMEKLPIRTYKALVEGIEKTRNNKRMTLVLALNYSAKWEIMRGVQKLAEKAAKGLIKPSEITEAVFENELSTAGMPDPELMIRTSGETRVSNFLLWQLAYAEFYFTKTYWPDFKKNDFYEAILTYQLRERRFGLTGGQVHE
jgi:undecaprenyl diphosphate synthase